MPILADAPCRPYMTTNVTDLKSGQMASDSRWSFDRSKFALCVDDVGFDKIVAHHGLAFVFAGNSKRIQEWKDWINTSPTSAGYMPSVNGVAVCMVERQTPKVVFNWGQDIARPGVFFAGSGSLHAFTCWDENKDAQKAVASAMAVDIFSGGQVKYLRFACGSHNIVNNASYKDINQQLAQKGVVMYHNQSYKACVPVQEAVANDSEVRDAVDQITSGALVASAPCDAMHNDWPDEKVEELRSVLNEYLAR